MVLSSGIKYAVELILNGRIGLHIVFKNEIILLWLNQALPYNIVSCVKIIHGQILMGVFLFGKDGILVVSAIIENFMLQVW